MSNIEYPNPSINSNSSDAPKTVEAASNYFPYASRDEKIHVLKKDIAQSLDLCVHPEHLNRIYKKLDNLKKFWDDEWKHGRSV